jgi:uncharacterized membrane-anchored protein YjiN (DUF445 family)
MKNEIKLSELKEEMNAIIKQYSKLFPEKYMDLVDLDNMKYLFNRLFRRVTNRIKKNEEKENTFIKDTINKWYRETMSDVFPESDLNNLKKLLGLKGRKL